MLVGQTGSGKSVCWKILQASMTRMKRDGESGFNIVRVRLLKYTCASCNISNTRRSVSSDIQTPRSELKNEAEGRVF